MANRSESNQTAPGILFAGGGTGGHIYMAVALARELERLRPGCRFLFVGTRRGLEEKILPSLNYDWTPIEIGGINRVGLLKGLKSMSQIPVSVLASRRILRSFKPGLVVGLGGYSAGPVVVAARWTRSPVLLIEPNVFPGLTNRTLARWASRIAVAYRETADWFGPKARLTGVPVRREFYGIGAPKPDSKRLRLLVFGGSQGSRPINELMTAALPDLPSESVEVVHQTGSDDFQEVHRAYESSDIASEVTPYLSDMPERFRWADLVLSRSGALTVAEIAAAGRASILIPFPQAADDHQRKNAEALASRKAAILLDQSRVSGSSLAAAIGELSENRARLIEMAAAAREASAPDSLERIVELIGRMPGEVLGPRPGPTNRKRSTVSTR